MKLNTYHSILQHYNWYKIGCNRSILNGSSLEAVSCRFDSGSKRSRDHYVISKQK